MAQGKKVDFFWSIPLGLGPEVGNLKTTKMAQKWMKMAQIWFQCAHMMKIIGNYVWKNF